MKSTHILSALVIGAVAGILSCSTDKTSTGSVPVVVNMTGNVSLPAGSGMTPADLTVGFGAYESAVDENGAFSIAGNGHVPGLALASTESDAPVLMAVVPDPEDDLTISVNIHSTAVALVFLNPLICTNNPDYIDGVLNDIENLSELQPLEYALADLIAVENLALNDDDWAVEQALADAFEAYVNGFSYSSAHEGDSHATVTGQAEGIEIDPDYQVDGLQLRWKGGSTFELTNSLGRWAYCTTPEDSFFVFPNGDFLDILKGTRPWSPQSRTFSMTVPANAVPQKVDVFGYGFAASGVSAWEGLTHSEQILAHTGGIPTIIIEVCAPIISVVTNTSVTLGREEIAQRIGGTVLVTILSQGALVQQLGLHAKNGDALGLSWTLSKHVMNELVTNSQFRAAFISATGMALTSASLQKLLKWISLPAKALMTFNSVTSTLKTAFGFTGADFKTEFEVWQSALETGVVRGQVADSISGAPLEGAVVRLLGDDDNPLQPAHQVTTGSDGRYYFSNIITGPKSILASRNGYAPKTIAVTIPKDEEVTANILLARQGGGITGRILDGILVHHGVNPATFGETVDLTARPASGGTSSYHYAYDGTYALNLSAGTWWIIASAENRVSDSLQLTVPTSGSVTAPRDLVLEPDSRMWGTVYLDMNNDGSYDQTIPVDFPAVGLGKPVAWTCDAGSLEYSVARAVRGSSPSNYDAIYIGFRTSTIPEAAPIDVGPYYEWPCYYYAEDAMAFFSTTRQHCTTPGGYGPMTFTLDGNPYKPGCNCGVSDPGQIDLWDWGTELGDLVAGDMVIELPGWASCYCDPIDTDGDGIDDDYDVQCARARVVIDFRLLVGSDYRVPWSPSPEPQSGKNGP